MKTIDIELALLNYFNFTRNIVVPNASHGMYFDTGFLHECDILSLTGAGYATEVEIKISASDLLADKKKAHGHNHSHIKNLYFAVPKKLKEVALRNIPEIAGFGL